MSAFASRMTAASLASVVALSLAGPSAAQSFLKNLALEAAQRAAVAAATKNANRGQGEAPAATTSYAAADDDGGGSEQAPAVSAQAASTGPTPWPNNVGSASVKGPRQLQFSAELEQQKKDFVEWSRVSCNACEGGRSYDAWAQHFIRLDGSWKAWEKKLGALGMGESVTWQGSQSKGQIKVVGETPIRDWPCKQLEWSLTRGKERITRPGLICAAPAGASGALSWDIIL